MLLDEHTRFLILNGMLNGHTDDDIMKILKLSEEKFASLIGFDTFQEYMNIVENIRWSLEISDVERFIINLYFLDYYCSSYIPKSDGDIYVFTVNMIRDEYLQKPYDTEILKNMLLDVLPSVTIGNSLEARDGVMTIPSKYEKNFSTSCVSAFKKYAYGDTVLTRTVFKDIMNYFDIVNYSNLSRKNCRQFIEVAAKNKYHLSILNQLVNLPLVDYLTVYSIFGSIIKISNDSEKLMVLTNDKNKVSKQILLSNSVLNLLTKTPNLLESCYYDDGYIMILTNSGYRPLILQEEADLY